MSSTAGEVACTFLIFIGLVMTIVAIVNPSWETTDLDTVLIRTNFKFNGLWMECQSYSSGQTSCETYRSFFAGLPIRLQAARAFSLFSLAIALGAMTVCAAAISKFPCSGESSKSRNRTRMIGGVLGLISGFSMLAGVSWFAADLLFEYYRLLNIVNALNTDVELIALGPALFIGWVAAGLEMFGGLIAVCISCGRSYDDTPEAYIPARREPKREYV